jgi:HSP20 family protein
MNCTYKESRMTITRYEPTDMWNRLQKQMSELFRGMPEMEMSNVATSQWMPLVDIKEEADKSEKIEVTMEHGALTIRGERQEEKREEKEGYHRVERSHGTFYRRFTMPDTADAEHIKASCRDGVLEIEVPKRAASKARRIEVKS